MCSLKKGLLYFSALMTVCCCLFYSAGQAAASDVCSQGTGLPPFLSSGADPNLLLLIDNSGSMLDMAYAGNGGECFDDGYLRNPTSTATPPAIDPKREYAGYFKRDSWYVWRESYYKAADGTRPYVTAGAYADVSYWKAATVYNVGALIIDNGIFYKATCTSGASCTSTATAENIDDDAGVNWLPASGIKTWTAGNTYSAGSFVKNKSQVFFLASPLAGASVTDPQTDSTHWTPVSYTWRSGASYALGDIVTYNGMVYRAPAAVSAKSAFDWADWQRLDEGYFEEVATAPCASPSYSHTYVDGGVTITDLQITMADAGGTTITNVSTQTPAAVTCFASRGNFLNWASASKFDIQKKILTGGKYYSGYEDPDNAVTTDNGDDRLIAENRGCAGTGYVKQVPLTNSTNSSKLTLRVRGAMGDNPWVVQTDDRVDTTDNTARIEVLAVSVSGFDASQCLAAAETLTTAPSGAVAKQEISDCLNYGGSLTGEENSTNISSLIECTQYWKGISINVNNIESHCSNIYGHGSIPSTITPWDPDYICYGVYNPNILTVADREGYFGACWGMPTSATGTCTVPASCTYSVNLNPGATGRPQKCTGGVEFQCPATATYHLKSGKYICSTSGNNDTGWVRLYKNASGYCTYDSGGTTPSAAWMSDPADCTRDAADKFCGQMKLPEVIDPSDKVTTTSETYNLPAMLIDAGVMGQLNTSRPLAVLKGYIKQPDKPTGILQSTADELNIGAMAFNSVGSASEASTNAYIDRFSPPGNKDGAQVISEIEFGATILDDNGTPDDTTDDRTHVDDLVKAVNLVRATSWTPLAEAMYEALGYYGQNKVPRLDPS